MIALHHTRRLGGLNMIYIAKLSFIHARAYRSERSARPRENSAKMFDAGSTDLCGSINLGYCYRARLRIRIIGRVNEPSRRGK